MKRFDFRLKSVLVLRRRLLNEAEGKYSSAIQRRKQAEAEFSEGLQKLSAMNKNVVRTRDARVAGYQQEAYVGALNRAKANLVRIEKKVTLARKHEEQEKLAYIEANKNHELLLKLRERQYVKHMYDEQLKEQLAMDDLFNARKSILNAAK